MSSISSPPYSLLGIKRGVDFLTFGDQSFTLNAKNYVLKKFIVTNQVGNVTSGSFIIYAAAGGTTALTMAANAGALTDSFSILVPASTGQGRRRRTESTLYFRMSFIGPEDPPATADLYVFGDVLS